ncbi:MAG: dihydroneopterin aldolase [Clostridiales bacterium GWB2_37_7]|nr:MAG: dihydroneopterin aldolase [Clostridiales bacterium GWB2_37_7]
MDRILLKNLCFYGFHGVLPEENKLGQKFIVDAALYVDLKEAGSSDDVFDTVNYAEVHEIIQHHVTIKQYKLLETLATNIANEIFQKHDKVQEIELTIKKPEAPVKGIFDYFAVEIRRKRNA